MWLRRSEATVRRWDFLRPLTSSRRLSSVPASAIVARSLRGGATFARSSRSRFSAWAFVSPSLCLPSHDPPDRTDAPSLFHPAPREKRRTGPFLALLRRTGGYWDAERRVGRGRWQAARAGV